MGSMGTVMAAALVLLRLHRSCAPGCVHLSPLFGAFFLPGQPAACGSACISLGKMKSRGQAARSQLVCRKPRADTCHDMGSLPDNAIRAVTASPSPAQSSAHLFSSSPTAAFTTEISRITPNSCIGSAGITAAVCPVRARCCTRGRSAPGWRHQAHPIPAAPQRCSRCMGTSASGCRKPPPPDPKLTVTPW